MRAAKVGNDDHGAECLCLESNTPAILRKLTSLPTRRGQVKHPFDRKLTVLRRSDCKLALHADRVDGTKMRLVESIFDNHICGATNIHHKAGKNVSVAGE